MEEDVEIPEAPQPDTPLAPEGPGPTSLNDDDRKRLAGILLKMKADKAPAEKLKLFSQAYMKKYGQNSVPSPSMEQPDYRTVQQQSKPTDRTTPQQLAADRLDINDDSNSVARRQRYATFRADAIKDLESDEWKNKIFKGKIPALTNDGDMPIQPFQKVDTKEMENYLDSKNLNPADRYWMRNQILNYGKQRQAQYYVQQRADKKIQELPADQQKDETAINKAYQDASVEYDRHAAEAIATKLNNVGIDDKPLRGSIPFHDQITGANKTLMGAINYAGDLGTQVSSLLELAHVPGLSDLGYHIKTTADNLKSRNEIPQTGELGNKLSGDVLPMALDMVALSKLTGAIGRPLYQSLAGARAAGTIGKFAEGVIGGVAVSPANSYIMAHQYYNQLVQQGMHPGDAAAKSDQLLSKNMATDILMTPLQMGLMRMPMAGATSKILGSAAEGLTSGLHFTIQDFNQKNTDNPAMHILDYLKDGNWKEPMITGAILGITQKAAVDAMHNWDVNSETKNMFSYGRKYGTDVRTSLPSNESIANNILSAIEMKDTPGRIQELKDLTQSLQESGVYRTHEAERINGIIDDVAAVKDQVPKFGNSLQRMAVFNELLNIKSADEFSAKAGNEAGEKFISGIRKESESRIQRIMSDEEPLYFVNGNETNKVQLMEAIENNPELLSSKRARIDIRNDPGTQDKIAELKKNNNAIQKQSAAASDVRAASGDSKTAVGRNKGEGAADEKVAREEDGDQASVIESRHSMTEHDEQGVVSGQNQIGLSDEGVVKAHELATEAHAQHDVKKVISSDLARAKETADIVGGGKIPVESRAELRSWDLKDFGGMKDSEFKEILKWFGDHPDTKVYNGDVESAKGKELGETLNEYANRAIEARKAIDKEGPGTFLVSHSNNMNIWDAYNDNGGKWDEAAIKDFMSRPSPEPAELIPINKQVEQGAKLIEDIESGKISDEQLKDSARPFIEHESEEGEPDDTFRKADAAEAGSDGDDEAPRQFSKIPGPQKYVPPSGGGQAAAGQNTSTQSIPASASAPDPARLTKNAKQLLIAGRSDDQILTYLQRKGLDPHAALAALGKAKANPIDEAAKAASLEEVKKAYFGKEDDWLGNKELNKVNSQQTTREYQDAIKKSIKDEKTQKGVKWKDIDKAIHIYLDIKRNPEHLKEYYGKLSPEQKRIVDLSKNLTEGQKEIADALREEYDIIGKQAKDEGLISDVLDNYVARAWDLANGKPATQENFKFNTSSKHQMHRTLETILQGYAEGMKLKIEGATNNLHVLKQEIVNTLENKRLLERGLALKYDSGETKDNGKPLLKTLFSTTAEPGYKKIDNPSFRKWEYAGKVKDYPEQEMQMFGRRKDTLITEEGTVMRKSDIYAPEDVAKSLNNILGKGRSSSDFIQSLGKFNAAVKQSILSYSGFHFIAFTRAHVLSSKFIKSSDILPTTAYKAGLEMLAEQHPIGQELIRNGMTLNRQSDWVEGVNEHNTWIGRQLDKAGWTKEAKDKLIGLNSQFHNYLFNTYGAGLKMFDGVNLVKQELARKPNADPKELYARVAKWMNDTYGGINWDRMRGTQMQNPTNRRLTSMLLLAPDWTASNLRMARKAFERGEEGNLYRKAWGRVILRGSMITTAANAIMSVWDDQDDKGNDLTWTEAMKRRYSKEWDAGKLRFTMIDITPLYHAIGGDAGKRAYFSIFGAYTDPMKMIANPGDFIRSKGSFISKTALEAMTAQNWQGREFTTLDELFGMDDKGTYKKNSKTHAVGEISQSTGKLYKTKAEGHTAGEEKGGKLTGQLTKWPKGGAHPVTWMQTPSFILNEVRGMMPTAIQSMWQIAAGENDVTTGILNAVGSNVLTNKDKKE